MTRAATDRAAARRKLRPAVGPGRRAAIGCAALVLLSIVGCGPRPAGDSSPEPPAIGADGALHVHPGESIQQALERAAADPELNRVVVHQGTYRPQQLGQALVWFNARHDGIVLEAEGEVVLTAENPELAHPNEPSYPAVVNHVVYFGDGISRDTVLRGFRITGANGFVLNSGATSPIERSNDLPKGVYYYTDGGGVKIYGRSYPTIERVVIHDNLANPCGGGVSIEHLGHNDDSPLFRDSVFRANRVQVTGSAIDVLPGSAVTVENCLFVGNLSNRGDNYVPATGDRDYNAEHGSGALTVFAGSRAEVSRSTFTGNWNGVDDRGRESTYVDSIFWSNDAGGGTAPGGRYELDLVDGSGVVGCAIGGTTPDLRGTIDPERNLLSPAEPAFDEAYRPLAEEYRGIGYRPVN